MRGKGKLEYRLVIRSKQKESNYLPAGWGSAWIQAAAFTIIRAALLGEGKFKKALTPKVLKTSHSSSGRGKKEIFFSGFFFFGSGKGWQRTVTVETVRMFLLKQNKKQKRNH